MAAEHISTLRKHLEQRFNDPRPDDPIGALVLASKVGAKNFGVSAAELATRMRVPKEDVLGAVDTSRTLGFTRQGRVYHKWGSRDDLRAYLQYNFGEHYDAERYGNSWIPLATMASTWPRLVKNRVSAMMLLDVAAEVTNARLSTDRKSMRVAPRCSVSSLADACRTLHERAHATGDRLTCNAVVRRLAHLFVRASDVRRAVGTLNDLTVDADTGEIRGVGAAPAQAAPAAPAVPAAARLSPGVVAVLRDADVTEAWAERVTVGLPARADFSFMSWNILANRFAPGPGRATHMAWRDRFNAIVARIVSVSPAILCVHELTNKPGESTYDELQAALAPCGYAGAVLTEGMATASAIFYDRKQFRHVVTFKNAADLARTGGGDRRRLVRVFTSAWKVCKQRACFALLEHIASRVKVAVVGLHTHVPLEHPQSAPGPVRADYLPLADAVACTAALKLANWDAYPTVWGCDMNAKPVDPAISYLVGGRLPDEAERLLAGQIRANMRVRREIRNRIWSDSLSVRHGLGLGSAYDDVLTAAGLEPPRFTNYNGTAEDISRAFAGALDYVFYSRDTLQPTAVLDAYKLPKALVPPGAHEKVVGAMFYDLVPNRALPSDHIAMVAHFSLRGAAAGGAHGVGAGAGLGAGAGAHK